MTERFVNDQQSGAACVILDGALTVRGIDAVQARLAAALRQHSVVTVDCGAATEIDLSLIQGPALGACQCNACRQDAAPRRPRAGCAAGRPAGRRLPARRAGRRILER